MAIEGGTLSLRYLDRLDGMPLLDLEPDRRLCKSLVAAQPGDVEIGA